MTAKTRASYWPRKSLPIFPCHTHYLLYSHYIITAGTWAALFKAPQRFVALHCSLHFSLRRLSNLIKITIQCVGKRRKNPLWIQETVRKTHQEMNPFASQFFHARYQKESHSVCVLWWEHGVLSVTHGKSGGVFFRPSFKLDVSPSLCTQQTAEVTQMRFFLLRSATCPDKTRRFQPPFTLSNTDPWKSGRMPTGKHIRTWQPHLANPQDGILPFFSPKMFRVKTNQSN